MVHHVSITRGEYILFIITMWHGWRWRYCWAIFPPFNRDPGPSGLTASRENRLLTLDDFEKLRAFHRVDKDSVFFPGRLYMDDFRYSPIKDDLWPPPTTTLSKHRRFRRLSTFVNASKRLLFEEKKQPPRTKLLQLLFTYPIMENIAEHLSWNDISTLMDVLKPDLYRTCGSVRDTKKWFGAMQKMTRECGDCDKTAEDMASEEKSRVGRNIGWYRGKHVCVGCKKVICTVRPPKN